MVVARPEFCQLRFDHTRSLLHEIRDRTLARKRLEYAARPRATRCSSAELCGRLNFRRLDQRAFRGARLIGFRGSCHLPKENHDQIGLAGIHSHSKDLRGALNRKSLISSSS
jgi:hypothetical protein